MGIHPCSLYGYEKAALIHFPAVRGYCRHAYIFNIVTAGKGSAAPFGDIFRSHIFHINHRLTSKILLTKICFSDECLPVKLILWIILLTYPAQSYFSRETLISSSQRALKSIPSFAASWGIRLVGVMPGRGFASRQNILPSSFIRKSRRA